VVNLNKITKEVDENELATITNIDKWFNCKTPNGTTIKIASAVAKFAIKPVKLEEAKKGLHGFKRLYTVSYIRQELLIHGYSVRSLRDVNEAAVNVEIIKGMSKISEIDNIIRQKELHIEELNRTITILEQKQNRARKKVTIDSDLLAEDEILLNCGIVRRLCGIYFLVSDEGIVYVGQSINITSRVQQHTSSKVFTHYTYVLCDEKDLDNLETKYINKFRPKYNFGNNGILYTPINEKLTYKLRRTNASIFRRS